MERDTRASAWSFENLQNFRSPLGEMRSIHRSAHPTRATPYDVDILLNKLNIKTLIDLRDDSETKPSDKKSPLLSKFVPIVVRELSFADRHKILLTVVKLLGLSFLLRHLIRTAEHWNLVIRVCLGTVLCQNILNILIALFESNTAATARTQKPIVIDVNSTDINGAIHSATAPSALRHIRCPLMGTAFFFRTLAPLLPRSIIARILYLLVTFQHRQIRREMAVFVTQVWTLSDVYINIIDHAQTPVLRVLEIIADERNHPVLIHCTHGKDRTGVIVSLVLGCLGETREQILYDYEKSRDDPLMPDHQDKHIPMHWLAADRELMERALEHIDTKYAGIPQYLATIGFGAATQKQLKKTLAVK